MVNLEGSLLSAELVAQVEGLPGQRDSDFDLPKGERLADAIVRAWSEARSLYQVFKSRMERVPESESGTSDTRRFWLEPLTALLGYDPVYQHQSETIEHHPFPISHRDSGSGTPLHLIGFRQDPDKRRPGVDRLSPHALLQEYLNRKEESLYGLLSNGLSLRLLRDNARLKQQQYAEWNLQRMFEEERFPEFAQMYRLLHASRLRSEKHHPAGCLLETYHQKGIEEGNRIRDGLRDAVMDALERLGNGFLQHRDNEALRSALRGGSLSPEEYNRQLRRLIYRLLFLLVAEERELIFGEEPATDPEQRRIRQIYRQHYSMARLREMAALRRRCDGQAQNIWRELLVTFGIFESEALGKPFGITPLDGELFHPEALGEMKGSALHNSVLLEALHRLNTYEDRVSQTRRRINYRSLDVEELGSVYESLLDLHPFIQRDEDGKMTFSYIRATERKTTGSYYTRHDLVAELLQSTLEPVMAERLRQAGRDANQQAEALLQLKVCDPSCGSGHFLLAAARRIALELAQVRAGGEQPTAGSVRAALREVIEHCVYGVDLNPDAVELCQVALWLESHCPGRPLGFLQHKIRCGNSLVGVHDLALLEKGLPDEAFKELAGDDKEEARALRKQNKAWREKRQLSLFGETTTNTSEVAEELGEAFRRFDTLDDSTVHGRQVKARTWEQLRRDHAWLRPLTGCNLFTAAFFQPIRAGQRHIGAELLSRQQKTILGASADPQLEGRAYALAERHHFFHWPLEFPDVFAQGGFDVLLGNPPWERIKLQQQEYFATRDAAIANAANKAERERLIKQMAENRPDVYAPFQDALHEAEATSKFLRSSERYALTAVGDINTYSVFSELFSQLVRPEGRAGFIVPTGIATDDSNKAFFGAMVEQNRLVSLFDFENREAIFPGVHRSYKFCLLTLSGASRGAEAARFGFFLTRTAHLQDGQRIFTLTSDDFLRLNPNTRTCPVFRTRVDAELTAAIYRRMPILVNETTGENPWGIKFMTMFHMSNDSHLFRTRPQLEAEGFV
ncbi:MAG: Eco57I restriction-modification methylase domain-containing protein, partial [Saprospiraceae bacterium]